MPLSLVGHEFARLMFVYIFMSKLSFSFLILTTSLCRSKWAWEMRNWICFAVKESKKCQVMMALFSEEELQNLYQIRMRKKDSNNMAPISYREIKVRKCFSSKIALHDDLEQEFGPESNKVRWLFFIFFGNMSSSTKRHFHFCLGRNSNLLPFKKWQDGNWNCRTITLC